MGKVIALANKVLGVLGCLLEYFGRLVWEGHTYLNTSVCWSGVGVGESSWVCCWGLGARVDFGIAVVNCVSAWSGVGVGESDWRLGA